jgi:hypothetical protein
MEKVALRARKPLVAKLGRDGHAELAAKARMLLATLQKSLELLREDLSRIENESRRSGASE